MRKSWNNCVQSANCVINIDNELINIDNELQQSMLKPKKKYLNAAVLLVLMQLYFLTLNPPPHLNFWRIWRICVFLPLYPGYALAILPSQTQTGAQRDKIGFLKNRSIDKIDRANWQAVLRIRTSFISTDPDPLQETHPGVKWKSTKITRISYLLNK